MKFLLVPFVCSGEDGDLIIPKDTGAIIIKAKDARVLESHWLWLRERFDEAKAIKPGSTFAELTKHFALDGGLHGGETWRFVHDLAPQLKLDVTFEGEPDFGKPNPKLKIKTVSRPYLDHVILD